MKHKLIVPFECKDITAEGKFTGMASMYGEVDLGGDVVERGAFSKTLGENPTVPVLWQHDSKEVIGSGSLRNTRDGLAIDGALDMEDPTAQKAFRKLKLGLMKGLSIGFNTVTDEVKNGVRHLKEVKLWEVSIVTFPMQTSAQVTSVKQMVLSHKGDFATEFDAAQTWAKRYQMMNALDSSLASIIWGDGSNEEKVAAAEESIGQFTTSFLDYLPQYLALMDTMYKSAVETFEKKDGKDLTVAHAKQIDLATKTLQARLVEAAHPGTSDKGAAAPGAETGYHSALSTKIQALRSGFQWNL